MNTTIRRHPRTQRDAFRIWPENCLGIEQPIACRSPWWRRIMAWFRGL